MQAMTPSRTMRERIAGFPAADRHAVGTPNTGVRRTIVELLWVALPKVLSGGCQLLFNLLLLRQLGADNAGVLFVCVTTILLSDALVGAAVDVGVIRLVTAGNPERPYALEVQKAALITKAVGSLALAIPILVWSQSLSDLLFHRADASGLLKLVILSIFGLLALRSAQTYFQVSRRFIAYGIADLLHTTAKFGGIFLLIRTRLASPVTVLSCYAIGPVVVALIVLTAAGRKVLTVSFRRRALGDLFAVTKWYLGAGAAGSVTSRMDLLMVSAVAGTAQAGLFSAAQVLVMCFQLLGNYLGVVFAPRIMPLWKAERFGRVYWLFQAVAVITCMVIYCAALAGIDGVMTHLLPSTFHAAKYIVLLLLPSSLMSLLNFPWTVSLLLFAHPRFLMALDLLALPVLACLYYTFILGHGAAGAAAVTSGYALVKTGLMQFMAKRILTRSNGSIPSESWPLAQEPSVAG